MSPIQRRLIRNHSAINAPISSDDAENAPHANAGTRVGQPATDSQSP